MRIKNIHDQIEIDEYMRGGHGQAPAVVELDSVLARIRGAIASMWSGLGKALRSVSPHQGEPATVSEAGLSSPYAGARG
jgi:hypothetical protein